MTLRSQIRSFVERRVPVAAAIYRSARERIGELKARPRRTPEGFRLLGDGSMHDGTFEPEERRLVGRLLSEADVFVDVGANVGYYTCMARAAGKEVVAVEPLESNLRLLFRGLQANGWDDIEVWPVGVTDRAGLRALYGGGTGASLVPGWAGSSPAWKETIAVTTLDTLFAHRFCDRRMLIKMDVEGAEFAALAGAQSLLARAPKPVWMVEISLGQPHPETNVHFRDTFDLFRTLGYRARGANGAGREVTTADIEGWVRRGDCDGIYNWVFEP